MAEVNLKAHLLHYLERDKGLGSDMVILPACESDGNESPDKNTVPQQSSPEQPQEQLQTTPKQPQVIDRSKLTLEQYLNLLYYGTPTYNCTYDPENPRRRKRV